MRKRILAICLTIALVLVLYPPISVEAGMKKPTLVSAEMVDEGNGNVCLRWEGCGKGYSYSVYISRKTKNKYSLCFDGDLYTPVQGSSQCFQLEPGSYRANMRSVKNGAYSGFSKLLYFEVKEIDTKPAINAIEATGSNEARVSWKNISTAEGYSLYISEKKANGKYSLIFDGDNYAPVCETYQYVTLTPGGKYRFNLRYIKNGRYSQFSSLFYFNMPEEETNSGGIYTYPGVRITQHFGENYGELGGHLALDIVPEDGEVRAIADGFVYKNSSHWQYGYFLIIKHEGFYSFYAHMSKPSDIKENEFVKAGQDIGDVGSTGESSGPHIHLSILQVEEGGNLGLPKGYTHNQNIDITNADFFDGIDNSGEYCRYYDPEEFFKSNGMIIR